MAIREIPVYRGLQRPVVFHFLRGRYIYIAGGSVLAVVAATIVVFTSAGPIAGILTLCLGVGVVLGLCAFIQETYGLNFKKKKKGIWVYKKSFNG